MAASTRREQASAETRRLILAAAKELYLEKGYRRAPTKELARRAGVAEGTVFAHFPDKASLLAAALDEDLEAALAEALASLPESGPCRARLLHLAGALYDYYALRPELSRALVKESLFLKGEWGQRIVESVFRFLGLVRGIIEQAREAGEYRPHLDPEAAARAFFGAYFMELVAGLSLDEFRPDQMRLSLDGQLALWEQGLLSSGS